MKKELNNVKCKKCNGRLSLSIEWKNVSLSCMECGFKYNVREFINELGDDFWSGLSHRPCNRV